MSVDPENAPFVNTQHSPVGAFASFTLGAKGPVGGFGLELGRPADQSVNIGLESAEDEGFDLLPFCELPKSKSADTLDAFGRAVRDPGRTYRFFPDESIRRRLTAATDTWRAGDLEWAVHGPVMPVPDPAHADPAEVKRACAPCLTATLRVDNRRCARARRFFFGVGHVGGPRGLRRIYDDPRRRDVRGVAYGTEYAFATDSEGVQPGIATSLEDVLNQPDLASSHYGLGGIGLLVGEVAAESVFEARIVLCFHREGRATTGLETRYLYQRFFPDLESVATHGLSDFDALHGRGEAFDAAVADAGLTPERRFMLAQSVHSYYGSTQLLEADDGPWWIVNEGEYRMMNTLDLTVDQLWFELRMNPWTVRNTLERALQRYSYTDQVRLPGEREPHPGGLSFTHDMGVSNHFSAPGHSAYERVGQSSTFSSMTHEELLNWTICALALAKREAFRDWGDERAEVMVRLLSSLEARDHPDPAQRNGIMSADSDRCGGGSEITTYDSLDPALQQARGSVYLAVKSWGAYVGLADFFARRNRPDEAERARRQAELAADTLCGAVR